MALCLITFKPNEKREYLKFLESFEHFDIYVIIDDNSHDYENLKNEFNRIKFIQIGDDICVNSGFIDISFITLRKNVTGWDKAIYYFTKINSNYSNVWFFEDDVYFNSENTIIKLDSKYKDEDILCNCSFEKAKLNEWLWHLIDINFEPPYFCGMMCCIRLSKKYMNCISDYIDKNKTMFFLEAFFPSIAKHYGLKLIENPIEFKTITHRNAVPHHNEIDIDYLYHPVKDLRLHNLYRKMKK
jgi:hypothetical protein